MRRHAAELVWIESARGGSWDGHLLGAREAIDRHTGQSARYWATIRTVTYDGVPTYRLTTRGDHPSSTRYRTFYNLTEAQMAGMRWAARRFYIEVPA